MRGVATWDDVRRIALGLPEAEERHPGELDFVIKGKGFAWERPLRKGDIEALGEAAPDGDVLAARVPDVGAKEALIADDAIFWFIEAVLAAIISIDYFNDHKHYIQYAYILVAAGYFIKSVVLFKRGVIHDAEH